MKVLYFTRDYTTHDHRFLTALANTEHKVFYLRLERRGRQLEDRALPPEIELVPWEGGSKPASWRDGPRLLAGLKRVIRKLKPDLILAGPLQSAAFLAALSGFCPLVSMSWGYDLLHDARRNALWAWATRYTLKRSAVMVGDCSTVRDAAISYGMPGERIVAFPWGVDLEHFSPESQSEVSNSKAQEKRFVLLSTRGWEPIYGVDLIAQAFVRAARGLSAENDPELHLIMLGNGSQGARLKQTFMQADLMERVHFPGQVGFADLPRYYRSSDLYVSASHSDGSSISLLEALACGLPALVSDIPGNREWVTPGQEGWWFQDGDVEGLCKGILQAVEVRAQLPEIGRAARDLAEQRADWNKNFQELLWAFDLAVRVSRGRRV